MLSVQDLVKRFGETLALDHVSFEVARGEVVGFLGPNGAGKSTTMRIVTGFFPPTSGAVKVDGHDVQRESLAARRSIGYLPESAPLYPDLRVNEYLRFRAQLKGLSWRARRAAVGKVLDRCLIADHAGRRIGTLSKGYRQRVGLADALLASPKLLVLDEPTSGMDPNQVREVRKLLRDLGREHTVLLSTHILPEVEAVCSRAVIIHKGRIVASEPVGNATAPRALELHAVGPEAEVLTALRSIPGVSAVRARALGGGASAFRIDAEPEKDLREAVGRKSLEAGFVIRELRPITERLEDLFVRHTSHDRAAEPAAEAPLETTPAPRVSSGRLPVAPGTAPRPAATTGERS